jgi:hypothetical protein
VGVWLGVDIVMVEKLWVSTQACSELRHFGVALHDRLALVDYCLFLS